jgi:hypothetical protein
MRKAMTLELNGNPGALHRKSDGNQNQWADKKKTDILFGYDADTEVDKWWATHGWGLEVEVLMRSKL